MYYGRSAVLNVFQEWEYKFFSTEGCLSVCVCVCETERERGEVCVNCTDCYFAAVPRERERKRKRIGGKQKNESGSFLFCSPCSG